MEKSLLNWAEGLKEYKKRYSALKLEEKTEIDRDDKNIVSN